MSARSADRFGVTWHPSIGASVLAHLDRLDILEVIPEGRFLESRRGRRALRRLARAIPVSIHGVSLGLASVTRVEPHRFESFARLVGEVEPESWSEHLAFVRAGGIELGHLAVPPRTAATIDATAEHLEIARRRVGSCPAVENVATPLDPPGSDRSEREWLLDLLDASPASLLLDLHNLYSNGRNLGFDPAAVLEALPAERIQTIHIAGGIDVSVEGGEVRRIDDHLHDVPDPVYDLLEIVGARLPHPVDVVLERDGAFPSFDRLLMQLDRARAALARGRLRAVTSRAHTGSAPASPRVQGGAWSELMVARDRQARLESFLARLYTDDALRARFVAAPVAEARLAGLPMDQAQQMAQIDLAGLRLAAASFAHKRAVASR